jgi:hypothetical protein
MRRSSAEELPGASDRREQFLYDIKCGSLRSPPAPTAGGRKRPSSPALYHAKAAPGCSSSSNRNSFDAAAPSLRSCCSFCLDATARLRVVRRLAALPLFV